MALLQGLKLLTWAKQMAAPLRSMMPAASRPTIQLVPCRGYAGPFHGTIEGISTTWTPLGRIKEHQDSLPCQPVPPLDQTMDRFLESVRCLLTDQQYQHAVKLAEDFSCPGGEGEQLQELLLQRADRCENWLADWWIKVAYLGYREPVLLNVNPSMVAPPTDKFPGKKGQLRLASMIIASQTAYKEVIDKQEIPIERIGGNDQCMIQHHHILGCCRVPGPGMDHVVCHHKHDPTSPRHVTVVHNNHLFAVDVLDSSGCPLSLEQLEVQLGQVVAQSETLTCPVGMLTAAHRDAWYTAYTDLRNNAQNAANFDLIHQSLFVVSLDQPIPGYNRDKHYEMGCWSHMGGGGSKLNTGNRWCDKILQYFVNVEGVWGFAYEHSIAEGPPVLNLLAKALHYVAAPAPPQTEASGSYSRPKRLDFTLNPQVEALIQETGQDSDRRMAELNVRYIRYNKKDRDVPFKKQQIYPDGFVQATIQLAYYKMYGHLVSTYESGSLRKFRLGRTDTIRSASLPVLNWCKAMSDNKVTREEKIDLLRAATTHHGMYTLQVSQGQSIDRHLLGLKLMALEAGRNMPKFLVDPVYMDSTQWKLSTTTVPMSTGGLVVFGPVVADGYGIYYNRQKEWIDFGITTWRHEKTDIDKFTKCLQEALDQSIELFHPQTHSKL